MNMTSTCTTCGAEIREGQGRYIIPLGPNVRVQITIIDPEQSPATRKEATTHGK